MQKWLSSQSEMEATICPVQGRDCSCSLVSQVLFPIEIQQSYSASLPSYNRYQHDSFPVHHIISYTNQLQDSCLTLKVTKNLSFALCTLDFSVQSFTTTALINNYVQNFIL